MATRRDKGDGTIYFNNAAQKWFASYPIGRYEGGRTKYRTFTGDTEMEVRRKMKSFKKTQNEISANAKSKWTLKRYMEYWLEIRRSLILAIELLA